MLKQVAEAFLLVLSQFYLQSIRCVFWSRVFLSRQCNAQIKLPYCGWLLIYNALIPVQTPRVRNRDIRRNRLCLLSACLSSNCKTARVMMFRRAENQIPTSRKLGVRTLLYSVAAAENRNFLWLFLTGLLLWPDSRPSRRLLQAFVNFDCKTTTLPESCQPRVRVTS